MQPEPCRVCRRKPDQYAGLYGQFTLICQGADHKIEVTTRSPDTTREIWNGMMAG